MSSQRVLQQLSGKNINRNNLKRFVLSNISRKRVQFIVPASRNFATSVESNTSGAEIPAKKHAPTKEVNFTADKYTYLRRNPHFKEASTFINF